VGQNDILYPIAPTAGGGGGAGAKRYPLFHASSGVTGAVDAEALPYNEAAAVASFAAPNTIFSVISFILGHFDAALIQQD